MQNDCFRQGVRCLNHSVSFCNAFLVIGWVEKSVAITLQELIALVDLQICTPAARTGSLSLATQWVPCRPNCQYAFSNGASTLGFQNFHSNMYHRKDRSAAGSSASTFIIVEEVHLDGGFGPFNILL